MKDNGYKETQQRRGFEVVALAPLGFRQVFKCHIFSGHKR
jgi:hypothetical protein